MAAIDRGADHCPEGAARYCFSFLNLTFYLFIFFIWKGACKAEGQKDLEMNGIEVHDINLPKINKNIILYLKKEEQLAWLIR